MSSSGFEVCPEDLKAHSRHLEEVSEEVAGIAKGFDSLSLSSTAFGIRLGPEIAATFQELEKSFRALTEAMSGCIKRMAQHVNDTADDFAATEEEIGDSFAKIQDKLNQLEATDSGGYIIPPAESNLLPDSESSTPQPKVDPLAH